MITITYHGDPDVKVQNKVLRLTQRNQNGGAIGDVVILNAGETAELTLETGGVQVTMEETVPLTTPPEETPVEGSEADTE